MNTSTTTTNVERLMGRAILDETFRTQLFINPEIAIQEAGLNLSKEEISQLKETINSMTTSLSPEHLNHQFEGVVMGFWN